MVLYVMPYKVSAYGISDLGLVRLNNEDFWAFHPEFNFFVLADGMGGHRAGEVASKEATHVLCRRVKKLLSSREEFTLEEAHGVIQIAIEQTNEFIYRMGRADHDLRGMGTTLCCLYFHPKGLIYANVGDSRIYRLRNHQLEQLTKDHSLLREMMDLGQLTEQQASDFLFKNIITRAIGTEASVEPSVHIADVCEEDIYLMCSDGLSDMISFDEIQKVLNESPSIESATNQLIERAKKQGGFDNITVVTVKVEKNETKNLPGQ